MLWKPKKPSLILPTRRALVTGAAAVAMAAALPKEAAAAISVTTCGANFKTGLNTIKLGNGGGGAQTGVADVPSGALLYLWLVTINTTVPTVSDTASNTYNLLTSGTFAGGSRHYYAYYVENTTALTLTGSDAITFNFGIQSNSSVLSAIYATGIATASSLDSGVTTVATDITGSSITVTSGAPAVTGELFIGAIAVNTQPMGMVQPSGWTAGPLEINTTSEFSAAGGYKINAGSSAQTYAPTPSASQDWVDLVVGFKPPAVSTGGGLMTLGTGS